MTRRQGRGRRRTVTPPAPPLFSVLTDDFTTLDTTNKWVVSGSPTIESGKVRLPVAASSGSSAYLASSGATVGGTPPDYTLKDTAVSFQLVTMLDTTGATAGSTGTWVRARILQKGASGNLTFRITPVTSPPALVLGVDGNETTVTYDPATMKWFRFREASGTTYLETSADNANWTTRRTVTTPTWLTSTANQRIYFDSQKNSGTVPTYWEIDNLNAAPPEIGVPGPVASASAVANTTDSTITVSWAAPTSDGGSPLIRYDVYRNKPDWTGTRTTSQFSWVLTNFPDDTYTVRVRAVNNIGPGPWTEFTVVMSTGSTPPPTGGSGTGNGFRKAILATSPTRYYPLSSQYPLNDMVGGKDLTNTGGGVTFSSSGALFQGTSNDYLTGPTGTDIQIGRSSWDATDASVTRTQMAFFIAVTFTTYTQPGQFHWMSCGGDVRGPGAHTGNFTWAMRLYGDGGGYGRDRGVSAYYWNPNPGYDVNGTAVPSSRGSGSYLAPPEGARTPANGPTGSGSTSVEHWFGIQFSYAGSKGYTGGCQMYYGQASPSYPMTLISNRGMDDDALITPVIGNGRLFIGKRGDSDGMVKATIRRVAFWDRWLTQTEWRSFANATTMALTEDG